MSVTAAGGLLHFAGAAGVALAYARVAWKKTYGACPATELPGSVRIAAARTALVISNDAKRYLRIRLSSHRL